jgi:hypothetical protein
MIILFALWVWRLLQKGRAFCFCTEGDRLLEVLHRSVEIALQ